jgi:phage-related baseplate assembly protein
MPEPFEFVPDVEFAPKDPGEIVEGIIGGFEKAWYQDTGEVLELRRPDARRMFLLYVAQVVIHQRVTIDQTGKQNLLKYMRNLFLDAWGGNWGERGYRSPASRALTTLRFALRAPLNFTVAVPIGTQVAATAEVLIAFQTTRLGTIPSGQLSVDIPAECVEPGPIGNDLLPGQVNRLVNWQVPFAIQVQNTTLTAGGAETENDERYRDTLWNLPESLSTCGTIEGYEWWAKKANPGIIDVKAWSEYDIAGIVEVYPLMVGGVLPSDEILEQVTEMISPKKRRPLNDYPEVLRPVEHSYDIDLDWVANEADATVLDQITANVQEAIDDFVLWTKSAISRDIIPSELHRRLLNVGAKRLIVREPEYYAAEYNEVCIARNITINFAGLEKLDYIPRRLLARD